jgi:hypothetical protein
MTAQEVDYYRFDAKGRQLSPAVVREFWHSIRPVSPFIGGVCPYRWLVGIDSLASWENNGVLVAGVAIRPVPSMESIEMLGRFNRSAQTMGGVPIVIHEFTEPGRVDLVLEDGRICASIVNLCATAPCIS